MRCVPHIYYDSDQLAIPFSCVSSQHRACSVEIFHLFYLSDKAYLWGILHSGTPRTRPWPHGIVNTHGWNNPSRWFLNADTLYKYQGATGNFRFISLDIIASNFISCKNFFWTFFHLLFSRYSSDWFAVCPRLFLTSTILHGAYIRVNNFFRKFWKLFSQQSALHQRTKYVSTNIRNDIIADICNGKKYRTPKIFRQFKLHVTNAVKREIWNSSFKAVIPPDYHPIVL